MNEMQPHKVEAGALRRWLLEAFELTTRKFWLWLVATILFAVLCSVAALGDLFYVAIVTLAAAGVLGFSYGVLIAAYADTRLSGKRLWLALGSSRYYLYVGRTILELLWRSRIFVGLLILGSIYVSLRPSSSAQLILPAFLYIFALGALSFFVYFALTKDDFETYSHRFLGVVTLALSWEESAILVHQGHELNRTSLKQLYMGGFLSTLIGLALTLFPLGRAFLIVFGVVVFPLVSSVLYISFRDIYLGVAENSPAKAEQRQGSPSYQLKWSDDGRDSTTSSRSWRA